MPQAWTPTVAELKAAAEAICGCRFNSVLLNRYRSGMDSMGWHADHEPELGAQPVIASVSLGVARTFDLRHNKTGVVQSLSAQRRQPAGDAGQHAGGVAPPGAERAARDRRTDQSDVSLGDAGALAAAIRRCQLTAVTGTREMLTSRSSTLRFTRRATRVEQVPARRCNHDLVAVVLFCAVRDGRHQRTHSDFYGILDARILEDAFGAAECCLARSHLRARAIVESE